MSRLLAIDPGNTQSGWCVIDIFTRRPLHFGKDINDDVLRTCYGYGPADLESCVPAVIEMVASYGMAVGKEVFETCVWIGRFQEALDTQHWPQRTHLVYRRDIKLHHCHSGKAKDSNVRQALVDRFAAGQPNHGKGTKADPGWFHSFRADVWQAYALAVFAADHLRGHHPDDDARVEVTA